MTTTIERTRPRRAATRLALITAAASLALGSAACVKPGQPPMVGNGTPIPDAQVALRVTLVNVHGDELAFLLVSFTGTAFMRTPDGENLTTIDQERFEAIDVALVSAGFGGDRIMPVATGPIVCSPDGYRLTIEYDTDLSLFDDCDIPEGFDATYDKVLDLLNDLDPASQ
jgi:hypothetical protein